MAEPCGIRIRNRTEPMKDRFLDLLCDMRCLVGITFLFMALFVSILVVGLSAQDVGFSPPHSLIIVDTDAGIDDAVAIMLLLEAEKRFTNEDGVKNGPKIIAFTTVNGNTGAENVAKNVLRLLAFENRTDIPVYQGSTHAIKYTIPSSNYFGTDGFGDVPDPAGTPTELLQKEHAVLALIKLVNKYPNQLTILSMGPMTNIALAIRLDPEFLTKLHHLYIMGGNIQGRGNVKPGIEFNFHMDPEANYIVLKDSKRNNDSVTLLAMEPANSMNITRNWRVNEIGRLDSKRAKFLNVIEHWREMQPDYNLWDYVDAALASLVIRPHIAYTRNNYGLIVVTEGELRGSMAVDYMGILENSQNVEIIEEMDEELFKTLLVDYIGAK